MKTNFRKTLAVLLAVLMISSVFSVTAFAANTVTYMPGEGVEGETYVDTFTSKHTIRGETYTREHFTQTGWSLEDGGSLKYNFGANYRTKKDLVLYPVWTGDVYTVTYAPGQYANETAEVTDDANYGEGKVLKGALFTREDYVQIGWSLEDGGEMVYELGGVSAIIEGDITLYPYWAQMYYITFTPGQYGVGEEVIEPVESGKTFSTKNAIYTREGYRQMGWSLEEGGRKVYDLVQNHVVADGDMTLYPYWVKDVYGITVSSDNLYFGDLCEKYQVPEAKSFVIKNTGNVPATVSVSKPANFTISLTAPMELAAGEFITVTVQPIAGLGFASYNETLVVTVNEDATVVEEVALEFSVSEHVFGIYKSDNNATYSADGTKTAYCVKGCGEPDTVADPGSMKVYSADNNAAEGILKSYVHHRTVRFTAYGSGMDDKEGVVGKRFVPSSWYVNDEFNGEFEDGYDVVFTHTIFGEYTLTVIFVEEEYNAETGEWVATGVTDEKVYNYTVGTNEYEEQEIVRPNTIVSIIFGLFAELFKLLGINF